MVYIYALRQGKKVVYVGQTNNVKRRVSQHKQDKVFDDVKILEELENPSKEEVFTKEDFFIMKYNPHYNKTLSKGRVYYSLQELVDVYDCKKANLKKWIEYHNVKPLFKDNYDFYQVEMACLDAQQWGTPAKFNKFGMDKLKKQMGKELFDKLVLGKGVN